MLAFFEENLKEGRLMDIHQDQVDFLVSRVDKFEFRKKIQSLEKSLNQLKVCFDRTFPHSVQSLCYLVDESLNPPPKPKVIQNDRIGYKNNIENVQEETKM